MDKGALIEYVSNKYNIKPLKVTGHSTFKNALYSQYSMETYINETEQIYINGTYLWGIIRIEGRKSIFKASKPYIISKRIKLESLNAVHSNSKEILYVPTKADENYKEFPKKQPNLNSPSEAYIKFTLLVQSEKIEDAKKLFSKELEDYRKEDLLTPNSSELVEFKCKLVKIENEKYHIKYYKKWKKGSFTNGTIPLIIENKKWVLSRK